MSAFPIEDHTAHVQHHAYRHTLPMMAIPSHRGVTVQGWMMSTTAVSRTMMWDTHLHPTMCGTRISLTGGLTVSMTLLSTRLRRLSTSRRHLSTRRRPLITSMQDTQVRRVASHMGPPASTLIRAIRSAPRVSRRTVRSRIEPIALISYRSPPRHHRTRTCYVIGLHCVHRIATRTSSDRDARGVGGIDTHTCSFSFPHLCYALLFLFVVLR